jgi:hypothetical protein
MLDIVQDLDAAGAAGKVVDGPWPVEEMPPEVAATGKVVDGQWPVEEIPLEVAGTGKVVDGQWPVEEIPPEVAAGRGVEEALLRPISERSGVETESGWMRGHFLDGRRCHTPLQLWTPGGRW